MKYKIVIELSLLFLLMGVCFATENTTTDSNDLLEQNNVQKNIPLNYEVDSNIVEQENNNRYIVDEAEQIIHTEKVTIDFDKNKLNDTTKIPAIYLTQDHPEYYGEIGGLLVNITKYSKNGYNGHLITIKSNTSLYLTFDSHAFERGANNTYTYEMLYGSTKNIIRGQYSPYKTYFAIYNYPSKNLMDIPHPDNYYRLIPEYEGSKTGTLFYGDIPLTTFKFHSRYVSKTYISQNNTFELEIYPYVAEPSQNNEFYVIKYNDTSMIITLKDNEKFNSTISYDGWFKIDIYKKVNDYKTVKKPVYTYKKVKDGYTWKYYKTKWQKTKIVTHKWKNGKLIEYHNKLRKVKNLLNKNGKIIKTIYGPKKTTVYIKYPVDHYKKVKKYKYIPKLLKYDSVEELVGSHYEFEKSENRQYIV